MRRSAQLPVVQQRAAAELAGSDKPAVVVDALPVPLDSGMEPAALEGRPRARRCTSPQKAQRLPMPSVNSMPGQA